MLLNKIKWAALAAFATGFVFTSAAVLGRAAAEPRAAQTGDREPVPAPDEPWRECPRGQTVGAAVAGSWEGRRAASRPAGKLNVSIEGGAMGDRRTGPTIRGRG